MKNHPNPCRKSYGAVKHGFKAVYENGNDCRSRIVRADYRYCAYFQRGSDKANKVQSSSISEPSKPAEKPFVSADKKEVDKPKAPIIADEAPKPPAPAEKTEADKQKEQIAQQIKELTEAGNKSIQSDNLEEAEKNFQKIIGLDKENKAAKASLIQIGKRYAELGKRLADAGDCQKSQSYFQSAKRLAPDDPDIVRAEAAAKEAKGTLNIHCDPQADKP